MTDLRYLGARRQKIVEMIPPPRRVFAATIARNLCPAEHSFNSATQPAGRLRLLEPDRFEHFHDMLRINVGYRHVADDRRRIGRERRFPLRSMLCVLPASLMLTDVGFGAFVEAHDRSAHGQVLRALPITMFNRVNAVPKKIPIFSRERTRLAERYCCGPHQVPCRAASDQRAGSGKSTTNGDCLLRLARLGGKDCRHRHEGRASSF